MNNENIVDDIEKEVDQQTRFTIAENNLQWLQEKIEKLNKKAVKLGCTPISMQFVETITKEIKINNPPYKKIHIYHVYDIIGESPIIAGWQLAGTLEHLKTDKGIETLVRTVPGIRTPDKYRNSTTHECEHCGINVYRKFTHIVKNVETGEFKRVGSKCIKDFLGHQSPQAYANWAEWVLDILNSAKDCENDNFFGNGYKQENYPLETFLSFVCESVGKHGWLSKAKADEFDKPSTSNNALFHMFPPDPKHDRRGNLITDYYNDAPWQPSEESNNQANTIIAWAKNEINKITDSELSDYYHNLKVILSAGYVNNRTYGFAASIVGWWVRENEKANMEKTEYVGKNSQHVGKIDERLRNMIVTITNVKIKSRDACYYGDGGVTYIVNMIDDKGNVLTWFASSDPCVEKDDKCIITGTVKDHNVFNNIKQTIITRCIIKNIESENVAA